MTLSDSVATRGQVSFLTEQWRSSSLATIWSRPDDWHGPATEAMAIAVVAGTGIDEAAGRLGADRARRGVGLIEGLDDLALLFELTGASDPPFAAARAFASEFTEVISLGLVNAGSIDSLTGLTTPDFLLPRLREVYAEAAASGIPAHSQRCFVVVDHGDAAEHGWQRVVRAGKVARVLSSVFDGGQTNAILASGTFVSLVRRDDALDENVIRLRRALSAHGEPAPTQRIEALPATVAEAEKLILQL